MNEWLQTEFLAIHRDILGGVLNFVTDLAKTASDLPDADCALQKILYESAEYGRDAKLIEEEDFVLSQGEAVRSSPVFKESIERAKQ